MSGARVGPTMSEVTFTIPPDLWLTANRHSINRGHRARVVRDIKTLAASTAMAARLHPYPGPVAVHWIIRYPKGVGWKHGDAVNAHPTTKALLDALVPKWLRGDGPRDVIAETFQRGPNLTVPRLHEITLVLTDQEIPF